MAFTMAALSVVCAILVAVFVPTKRIRTSVPHLAIALWLGGFNLIHGVNAFVWAGNINIHIPVWCDIMTKLMLGTAIALPGAFLCIAMELRLMASDRKLSTNPIVVRNRKLLEVFLCYILPVLYMASRECLRICDDQ
ncbi:hypothetical protein HYPSUDRAFT_132784 [Hypholoma sublateritium FD-334 SS-4]|uniref:Uncharacterized protein n=1 Tax=Hypholoma sublateritium (strain FD-334 SS-4) TaxID=945553 RepID=A0A0D2P6E8_HYPSF|nr:hypothetical protein HYPSUDRAFT_132784 [Hypholoma sublateritium FD-334 SS-4]